MYLKYKQNNLHRMIWYTGRCNSNDHGFTIHVSFMVKRVIYMGLLYNINRHDGTVIFFIKTYEFITKLA